jgi:hypothetical protein
MAVHPTSREIYLSVSRHSNGGIVPAIVKVSLTGTINEFKLNSPARSEFKIADAPEADQCSVDTREIIDVESEGLRWAGSF